jgi:tRNA(adenine34) deaminase
MSAWIDAMSRALDEAKLAGSAGDVPVGAALVSPTGELFLAHNQREVLRDPTAHAEILALQKAARALGHWRLVGWTCVVTLEPCVMCAGALVNARVSHLVYGCDDPKAGAIRSLFSITSDERLNHRLTFDQGVLAEQSSMLLKDFFAQRRQKQVLDEVARAIVESAIARARDGLSNDVQCGECGSPLEVAAAGPEVWFYACKCGRFRGTLRSTNKK